MIIIIMMMLFLGGYLSKIYSRMNIYPKTFGPNLIFVKSIPDGDAGSVEGAQVRVLEQGDQERLGGLLPKKKSSEDSGSSPTRFKVRVN
jgi:hypothetical protein